GFSNTLEYGGTFHIGTSVYMIIPSSRRFLPAISVDNFKRKSTRRGPATVFWVARTSKEDSETVTLEWLVKTLDNFLERDGVFQVAFLETVIFKGGGKRKPRLDPEVREY